jgi:hypothetical protein
MAMMHLLLPIHQLTLAPELAREHQPEPEHTPELALQLAPELHVMMQVWDHLRAVHPAELHHQVLQVEP